MGTINPRNGYSILVTRRGNSKSWILPSLEQTAKLFAVTPRLIKDKIEDGGGLVLNKKLYFFDYWLDN